MDIFDFCTAGKDEGEAIDTRGVVTGGGAVIEGTGTGPTAFLGRITWTSEGALVNGVVRAPRYGGAPVIARDAGTTRATGGVGDAKGAEIVLVVSADVVVLVVASFFMAFFDLLFFDPLCVLQ